MKKINFLLAVGIINLLLCLTSYSGQVQFQYFLYDGPENRQAFQTNPSFINLRAEIYVNGAIGYHHVVCQRKFIENIDRNDQSFHRPDNYSFERAQKFVLQSVYIYNAPGLVKVQMAIFQNGIKKKQNFGIGAQFDRGYNFKQVFTTVSCSIKLSNFYWWGRKQFSMFSQEDQIFNASLPEFLINQDVLNLPKPGRYYLRFKHIGDNNMISYYGDYFSVKTFSQGACQNSCPYTGVGSKYFSVRSSVTDFCQCVSKIFDPETRDCIQCFDNSTALTCKSMVTQICGNEVRQGSQQCDNFRRPGCRNCIVEQGYTCIENQLNRSECQMCGNSIKEGTQQCDNGKKVGCMNCNFDHGFNCTEDENKNSTCFTSCGDGIRAGTEACDNQNMTGCTNCSVQNGYVCTQNLLKMSVCQLFSQEQQEKDTSSCLGSECNSSYKIIIGVCVGVGLAIILGLAIYWKYLKSRKQAYLDKSSKPNVDVSEERIGAKEKTQSLQIII